RRQLQTATRQAHQQKVELDQRRMEQQEAEAASRELQRLTERTQSQEQKIMQIVDRVSALLDEGNYAIAEEQVAPEINRLAPGSTIQSAVALGGPITRAVRENQSLWQQRHDNSRRALASVESAAVPFSDDP